MESDSRDVGRGTQPRTFTVEGFGKPVSGSIPSIIRGFKSTVTKQINEQRDTPAQRVWQRNYYEHIIRDENSLNQIREYIIHNTAKWEQDKYYR